MIAVTGANGYIGARILARLRERGADAVALVRSPRALGEGARRFALGEELQEGSLAGARAVVHCAWDLQARGADAYRVNCLGSLALVDAAAAQSALTIFISSLSAFPGARSRYGQAKLWVEQAVAERGGVVLRPGLVFGAAAGGMFGTLARVLAGRRVIPMVGAGAQRLFLSHDRTLAELVCELIAGERPRYERPLFAAHEQPLSLRALAVMLASGSGPPPLVVGVPARPLAAGMRAAEALGVGLPLRADSLTALLHPAPLSEVARLARGPLVFPPPRPELWRA
ncbi:MAG TPA: sugar nucleotide-binding protein [Solirubrobacteraceae bacterium]|nr:sugar nucleotide-binding protein [Solirubrobacteraceae bacterium]